MRSEFEKLPEVEKCLRLGVSWNGDCYEENKDFVYESSDWVNGAWYAFQEQQKIINMQECAAKQIIEIINNYESSEKPASFCIKKIKEILK